MLEIEHVDVVWRTDTTLMIQGPIQDGERVVTSKITSPVKGTKLRLENEKYSKSDTNIASNKETK